MNSAHGTCLIMREGSGIYERLYVPELNLENHVKRLRPSCHKRINGSLDLNEMLKTSIPSVVITLLGP